MTDLSRPRREMLDTLPHQGVRQIHPGLSVATMPRPQAVTEVHLAPQAQTIAIYARRARSLRAPVARDLPDCIVEPRTVMILPAGLATQWIFAAPLTDAAPRLQTLHLRLDRDFASVTDGRVMTEDLAPQMNLRRPGLPLRMERALQAFEEPEAFRSLALQSAAFAAAMMLFDPRAEETPVEASSLTPRRRRALAAYVDDNLSKEVTLSGMADSVGLSPWYFIRVFKAAMGMTPYAWVMVRRVDLVKQRLNCGDASLAGVAHSCGFATQSHMTEVFRRMTGTTPGRWRGSISGKSDLVSREDDGK